MVGIENLVTVCLDVLQLNAEGQHLWDVVHPIVYIPVRCSGTNRLWELLDPSYIIHAPTAWRTKAW